jgi:hypothetical protein
VNLVWAQGIPLGISLMVIVSYGLILTLILPSFTIYLNRLWKSVVSFLNKLRSKPIDREFYPDRNRDVASYDLEVEAAFAGNEALVRYAREHTQSVIDSFRRSEHFVFIGCLLVVEYFAPYSAVNQFLTGQPYALQKGAALVVLIVGVVSIFVGARPESVWCFSLSRPNQNR